MKNTQTVKDFGGIVTELVKGEWQEPGTGKRYTIPPEDIVIAATLDGAEAELIAEQHPSGSLMVVSDPFTHDALGSRIAARLKADGRDVKEWVWQTPSCSDKGVEQVQAATRGVDAIIAVGSGTINDSVKYASFLDGRDYSVFATSPMNAYTTNTASVSFGGYKKSITCHGAKGIYFDLEILAQCPKRLVSAAFADVICRTTAQVDWLMSHMLFDTPYADTPYVLLAYDEDTMIDSAPKMLTQDIEALGMLTRIAAIMGLGTTFTETTHSGSMAEHMISHYIDMFAGKDHPGTSHGEQVGVATITMSRLQNAILNNDKPPVMQLSQIPSDRLRARYGDEMAENMIEQTSIKALDKARVDALNQRFDDDWAGFTAPLKDVMLPFERLNTAMQSAGCQRTAEELGVSNSFYVNAVNDARFIRDRFSMLDIAADSGQLEAFAASHG